MRTPTSTYRLQITREFTLFDAAERVAALAELGVDWLYLSPLLQATEGSMHGYDVTDHSRIDADRGGAEGLAALSAAARAAGMGILVDIVPNHVGVERPEQNAKWWQLLRDGRTGPAGDWFDVDWDAGGGRVRIPVVGDDDLCDDGSIANLHIVDGELRYHGNRYPLRPGTTADDPNAAHREQHYELVHWQRADRELNYRRFFAVNTLAAIRVENDRVFDESHAEIRRWFAEGLVDGLRVDHPDGLRDPAGYLARLREVTGGLVLVEKILEPGEELEPWAVDGTTGYDSLALIDRVLTDAEGQDELDALDAELRGLPVDWSALTHLTKRGIADTILGSEVQRVTREIEAEARAAGEAAPAETADALAELLACFPVYRSYLPAGRHHLDAAAAASAHWRPDLAEAVAWLLPRLADPEHPAALRFQQTSGMVMAKGVEDTALYRYARLTSLNEVGGDPSVFAVEVDAFHDAMRARQASWPHTMNALSTHDTKRGEDVRAAVTTIAETPGAWRELLERLLEFAPNVDRGFSNLVVQAAVGAWPISRGRLSAYAEKAAREADARTHWTDPNEAFEDAMQRFVGHIVDAGDVIEAYRASAADAIAANVLGAKLLNLTIPGFPDVYQGSEARQASLVDPDNRRPVPWEALDALRAEAATAPAAAVAEALPAWKTRVTRAALTARRDRAELFTGYRPLAPWGEHADNALAFDRGGAITVVTRLAHTLAARGGFGDTGIDVPPGRWRDAITGREFDGGQLALAELLRDAPVALLLQEAS